MQENNKQTTIQQNENAILQEERAILKEVRNEERAIKKLSRNIWVLTALVIVIIVGGVGGSWYWLVTHGRVYTDKAQISAPRIDLAPQTSGTLEELFVHQGDRITTDTVVARVGNELIKAGVGGIVTVSTADIGKLVNRGEPVVSMFDPAALRVVGRIKEDQGLSDIRVGQIAHFTVDAFGSKDYEGVVDEISSVSREGDIVFNISDKREVREFDVKVRFNTDEYPELKNGMSAKLWITKG